MKVGVFLGWVQPCDWVFCRWNLVHDGGGNGKIILNCLAVFSSETNIVHQTRHLTAELLCTAGFDHPPLVLFRDHDLLGSAKAREVRCNCCGERFQRFPKSPNPYPSLHGHSPACVFG